MATTTSTLSGVVINEIGTNPTTGQADLNGSGSTDGDDEFIEFYNTSGSTVDISGWQVWIFSDGITTNTTAGNIHTFAPGTTLEAGDRIVVVDQVASSGTLLLSNSVYANPTVTDTSGNNYGLPTFMSLTDSRIVVLYDPVANQYIQFSGEDSDAADQADVTNVFSGATLVGSIERGLEDNSGNSAQRSPDGDTNWVDFTQTPGAANLCFGAGTQIATPGGSTAVEALAIGDVILTADGASVAVKWLGRQTVSKQRHGAHMQPVRIRAGALGGGLPHSDLTVTADHGMVLDGLVINASALVNGDSIHFVPLAELEETFTVYHIETEAHDVILANGAASETFIDMAGRSAFDNYQEYLDLYGAEHLIREMPLPRIAAPRLVPQAIQDRLGAAADKARAKAA